MVLYRNVKRNFFRPSDGVTYEKLIGAYSLERVNKNGVVLSTTADSLMYKDLYIEKQSRWNILRRNNNETDAFVLNLAETDSIELYINKNGIGDSPDVLDSLTAIKGVYKLDGDQLTIKGIQVGDTLALTYRKRDVSPKKWFW